MHEKVRALIERRIIEANEKKITNKLYSVAKVLGRSIISQNESGTFLQDVWKLPDDELPEYDDWEQQQHGFYFDGLKCGINLCIKAIVYDEMLYEIKSSYNGYLVYHEEEGQLRAYAPFPEWENQLEMFYEASVLKEQRITQHAKQEKEEQKRKRGESFFKMIRSLWGY